ncbi:hypothetical protein, partial [Providencia rettgeri]|uniref:hypothetical protein n=1 Tax=Providencia rettgeri TaxID=587 RepID=UPI001AAFC903
YLGKLVAGSGRRLNSQNLNPARPTISTAVQANSLPRKYSVGNPYLGKLVAGSGRRLNSQNLNPARPTISTAVQANSPPRKYSVGNPYLGKRAMVLSIPLKSA